MTDEASGMVLTGIANSRKAALAARGNTPLASRSRATAPAAGQGSVFRSLGLEPAFHSIKNGSALGDETRLAALVLPGWRFAQRRSAAVQRWQGGQLRFR